MRDAFSKILVKEAKKNKKIYIVVSDISPAGDMGSFQKKNKDRFINVGVAEQTMIGVCAGLALAGKKPFAYTIATFSLYRPFEMIRNDLCYQKLPVTVVGMGAGTIYSTLGGTHLTQEDIAIARSIPNMKIIAPCDPEELIEAVKYCVNSKFPIYLRIGKAGEKIYTKNCIEKWKFGKIRKIVKGKKICILSYGPIIKTAFELNKFFSKKNLKASIYSCHTLKPFNDKRINKIFKSYKKIIIIEDHSKIGGLGEMVKKIAFENKYSGEIINFGLKDEFIKCYGNQQDLLSRHGLSLKKIYNKAKI